MELKQILRNQLNNILSFDYNLSQFIPEAADRTERCLRQSTLKHMGGVDPYNSCSYSIFLYYLSNTIFKLTGESVIAEKIYYLNKILNDVELFYEVELPDYFMVQHPLGSVMGRATYSDFFVFYQGCTVGGNKGHYPKIGSNVIMFSNSKILGNCNVGSHVIFSANAYVIDENIPDYSIVFPGNDEGTIIKSIDDDYFSQISKDFWRINNSDLS